MQQSCSAAVLQCCPSFQQGPRACLERESLGDKGVGVGAEWSAASQVGVAMHTSTHAQRRRRTMSRYSTVHQICAMRLVAVRVSSVLYKSPLETRPGLVTPVGLGLELTMAGARNVRSPTPKPRSGPRAGSSGRGWRYPAIPQQFSYCRSCRPGSQYGVDCLVL